MALPHNLTMAVGWLAVCLHLSYLGALARNEEITDDPGSGMIRENVTAIMKTTPSSKPPSPWDYLLKSEKYSGNVPMQQDPLQYTGQNDLLNCDFERSDCFIDFNMDFSWTRTNGRASGGNNYKPSRDHTTGTSSGRYMYATISSARVREKATMGLKLLVPSGQTRICVEFWYLAYGRNLGTYSLLVMKMQDSPNPVWNDKGSKGNNWINKKVSVNVQSNTEYAVGFETIKTHSAGIGGLAIDDLKVKTGSCNTQPPTATPPTTGILFSCNFDTSECLSQSTSDDFDWTRSQRGTPSSSTGPDADHTTGSGYFMFIENSGSHDPGDEAALTLRTDQDRSDKCLSFWYYMYGSEIGTLRIERLDNGEKLFEISGEQGNRWIQKQVSVPGTCNAIQLIGVVGNGYMGDIAIDDVVLVSENCPAFSTLPSWGEWSFCSAMDCVPGFRVSFRNCTGRGCGMQSRIKTKACMGPCWVTWTSWARCTVTCGNGTRMRTRVCNGEYCPGRSTERSACPVPFRRCPLPWGPWSACSPTCGPGVQSRRRPCQGVECLTAGTETKTCWTPCRTSSTTEPTTLSTATPSDCIGTRTMTGSRGNIYSPGYTDMNTYSNNLDCSWRIVLANSSKVVRIDLIVFWTERAYDLLEIYDGPDSSKVRLARLSGIKSGQVFISSGSQMYLRFTTDGSATKTGFSIQYRAVDSNPRDAPSICGKRPGSDSGSFNILGGQRATPHSWPWLAPIMEARRLDDYILCTGIILTRRHVLVPASCIGTNKSRASSLFVNAGAHAFTGGMATNVSSFVVHEKYSSGQGLANYDIAMIKLQTSLRFSNEIAPLCLPTTKGSPGKKCYVAGWGRTVNNSNSRVSTYLKEVQLEIIPTSTCERQYSLSMDPFFICAGTRPSTESANEIDWGSPLMCDYDGRYHATGAFNFLSKDYKGANGFINLYYFKSWISEQINP